MYRVNFFFIYRQYIITRLNSPRLCASSYHVSYYFLYFLALSARNIHARVRTATGIGEKSIEARDRIDSRDYISSPKSTKDFV